MAHDRSPLMSPLFNQRPTFRRMARLRAIRAHVRAPAPSSSGPLLESSDAVFTLPAAAAVRQRHGYIFSLESWESPDTDYTLEGVKP